MSVSYAVRVDERIRDEAAEVARSYGLDLATATRAFWTQMARTKCLPLLSHVKNRTGQAWRHSETEEIFERGTAPRFKDVDALFASLEA